MPALTTVALVIEVLTAGRVARTFPVTFYGPDADANAAAFIERKRSVLGGFYDPAELAAERGEDMADIDPAAFPLTVAALHPECHHGMSLALCMDPIGDGHFGTYEQDLMALDYDDSPGERAADAF